MIHPNPGPRCETFIQAHIDRLPGVAEVLYGGHMPFFRRDGTPLLSAAESADLVPGADGQGFPPDGEPRDPAHVLRSRALARFLREREIGLVLAEYGPTGVAVMAACAEAGTPFAVHFHGFDASLRPVLEKYRQGYGRMFRRAAALVAVSRRMESDLLALGAPGGRLFYNVYGVDTGLFTPAAPGDNPPLFAAVGRFVDKKAPHLTILAFAEVLRACPEARLVMLGDGPLREACRTLVRALGLERAVELPGDRPPGEVAALLGRARAFVQHSLTPESGDREGTPNAVLEAGASGLPVVSTRHAGIPDVVLEGETGLLGDEGDVQTFAAHMLRLAREPQTAARLGRTARAHVQARYGMAERIAALARILHDARQRKP